MSETFIKDGLLLRIFKNGHSQIPAYLEDYATAIDAWIQMYRIEPAEEYLINAYDLSVKCMRLFYDSEKGFFRFSQSKDKELPEAFYCNDDVINSGNSIMAHNLFTLSWYFGMEAWRTIAKSMCDSLNELLLKSGPWYSNWAALKLRLEKPCTQFIVSCSQSSDYMKAIYMEPYHCNLLPGMVSSETKIPLFQGKEYSGKNLIYRCEDKVCGLPYEFEFQNLQPNL